VVDVRLNYLIFLLSCAYRLLNRIYVACGDKYGLCYAFSSPLKVLDRELVLLASSLSMFYKSQGVAPSGLEA